MTPQQKVQHAENLAAKALGIVLGDATIRADLKMTVEDLFAAIQEANESLREAAAGGA